MVLNFGPNKKRAILLIIDQLHAFQIPHKNRAGVIGPEPHPIQVGIGEWSKKLKWDTLQLVWHLMLLILVHHMHKFVFSLSVDVFTSGHWSVLRKLNNHRPQDLAKVLPLTVLHCKASSTSNKYLCAFRRWKLWAAEYKLPVFLAIYVNSCGSLSSESGAN